MHPASLSRRAVLGGGLAAATLPWDLARAQSPGGGSTLRVGMTANAVPLANGVPDQGAEGHRFMGITLFDQLVRWTSRAPTASQCRSPAWPRLRADAADRGAGSSPARGRCRFHDGKPLTAEDVVFSFDRLVSATTLAFDQRGAAISAQPPLHRGGLPARGPRTLIIDCKRVDSQLPALSPWIGITHQGAWEAAGRSWDASCSVRSAPAPGS
jgi:hypothetical protein